MASLIAWAELLFVAWFLEEPFVWAPAVGWPVMCVVWYGWMCFCLVIYRAHLPFDKYVPIALNIMLCLLPVSMAIFVPIGMIVNLQ